MRFVHRALAALTLLVVLCYSSVALAADGTEDPFSTVDQIIEAARAGRWLLVAAGLLALAMFGLKHAREKFAWFKGDRGGAILVIVLSLLGALSTSLAAGQGIDWKLIVGAIAVAWTASGGYTNLRRIIWPQDQTAAPPPVTLENSNNNTPVTKSS